MNRLLLLLAALVATTAIACGSGDKADDNGDERPSATATSPAEEASSDTGEQSGDDTDLLSDDTPGGVGLFGPLVGLGLGGVSGDGLDALPGALQGSGDLEQYLPGEGDLPDGYTSMGVFSVRVPENTAPDFPGGEFAMSIWSTGDVQSGDIPQGTMLMFGVMEPDDAGAISGFVDQCGGVDESALNDSLGDDGSTFGIKFKDIETLDSSGLGDEACGIGLTMDMSGFFEALAGFGDSGDEPPQEAIDALSAFKMRMRFFGEGGRIGMVMQIGFGDDATMADDLPLAQKLRGNLQ